ncbi:MAG: DUF4143 domain-containing protein [Propionibacteriaceae bacterium]|jgi:predicted AAA+ superfamily ATPase|nr:DUF4143 domain-containing protein [Propionibacteriaceae bacterium]
MKYLKRLVDEELVQALRRSGAVLIEGARGCGKTSTAEREAGSVFRLDTDPLTDLYMQTDPSQMLEGASPRLLDEWQIHPKIWDLVRRAVDDRQRKGQFILTGSVTPEDTIRRHSGAGRFTVIRMRPLTLWEEGKSDGEVSLGQLRKTCELPMMQSPQPTLNEWTEILCRGGWPAMVEADLSDSMRYVKDYLDLIVSVDVGMTSSRKRDPIRMTRLIASLARNTSSEASINTLRSDAGGPDNPLARDTTSDYLDILERLMVIEPLPAWQTALRGSATLRQAPKWHFVDPSLAVSALRANPAKILKEPKTLGMLFESLAIRDLRTYAEADGGVTFHARDSVGREADLIIEYSDGWMACEIKLGMGQADQAAESLTRFCAAVDTQTVGPCLGKIVIVGNGPAYQRNDGIMVVPLASLRQ